MASNIGIGIANAIGFTGRKGIVSVPPEIESALVVHYDIARQGKGNIISTGTLKDFSQNNINATCNNFDWTNAEFPDDEKALRFDGNSNCVVATNLPILEEYTIIAKRRWIDKTSENKWFCSLGNGDYSHASQSLFWFEGGLLNGVFYTYNKGYKNPVVLPELISIQSSNDYNGVHINSSNAVQGGNKLYIGSIGEDDNTNSSVDLYQLLIFNRVLTEQEREWVKNNIMDNRVVPAERACIGFFEPDNLIVENNRSIIRDSLNNDYYVEVLDSKYEIENGLIKATDSCLVSIENIDESNIKAMLIDLSIGTTIPESYVNGYYLEAPIAVSSRRILGINSPMTKSIFEGLYQTLITGETIGKIALYGRELTKDEFDTEAVHKGFAVHHSVYESHATCHLFRNNDRELYPGDYLLPFEELYLRVDVEDGYVIDSFVVDNVEQKWMQNSPVKVTVTESDLYIIATASIPKVIDSWSPISSISTFLLTASTNKIEFLGSTDGGTLIYELDNTDVTKFTIEYTNSEGEGTVYLDINGTQYELVSGQAQTYSVEQPVQLHFFNLEEVTNFAGVIEFSNIN